MTNTNLNYDLSSYYCSSQQGLEEQLIGFKKNFTGYCFANSANLPVSESFDTIVQTLMASLEEHNNHPISVMCLDSKTAIVRSDKACLSVEDEDKTNYDFWKSYDRILTLRGYGEKAMLKSAFAYMKANLKQMTIPQVTWEFLAGGERRSQDVQIERAKPIYKEFYPWLAEDTNTYFDRFLASDSSILVLLGPPGTAKTSFIRSMIWHGGLNTMFTYEEKLLESDSLFVDFIVNDRMNLLVVEDADLFLTSRDHDGNKIMSKFLNVSDGLISVGKKKIIFTANILEPGRIDNALLRAGRCFDCLTFRRLTYNEAVAACTVAGIKLPVDKNRSYNLAELFADNKPVEVPKIGFGR